MSGEDFESFAASVPTGAPLDLFCASSPCGARLDGTLGGQTSDATSDTPNNNGRYFGSSPNVFWDDSGEGFHIVFATAITAFGFDWADVGDFSGADDGGGTGTQGAGAPLTVCLSDDAQRSSATRLLCEDVVGSSTDGAQGFAGVLDSTPGSLGYRFVLFINNTGGLDGQAFDNFTAGLAKEVTTEPPNPTPEPGSMALLGLGLLGLAGLRRRR